MRGGFIADNVVYDIDGKKNHVFTGHGQENHLPAFIAAIKANNPENLPISIEDGHISAALCHIGNISHRVGQLKDPEQISDSVRTNELQNETWQRVAKHLANKHINIQIDKLILGKNLTIDPTNEMFIGTGAQQANLFLKDKYREEWTIPEVS